MRIRALPPPWPLLRLLHPHRRRRRPLGRTSARCVGSAWRWFWCWRLQPSRPQEVGLAALFLASKVEEPRKRLADLITYFYEECRKQNVDFEVPHPSSQVRLGFVVLFFVVACNGCAVCCAQSFKTLKQAILNLEMLLLDAVEFNFNMHVPPSDNLR